MPWKIDTVHSEINFTVRHMMISNVRGRFERFSGTVNFDENDPSNSSLEVQIEAASINTRESQRDGHLRSPDFFDAEKFPYLTFKGTKFEVLDPSKGRITGDLTIRDKTHPVTLDVDYNGMSKSPWGTTSAGFSATTAISRKEWNLTYNVALETGGWMLGDEIKIHIEVEMVKLPEAETVAATA